MPESPLRKEQIQDLPIEKITGLETALTLKIDSTALRTINGESLIGTGDIVISAGGPQNITETSIDTFDKLNNIVSDVTLARQGDNVSEFNNDANYIDTNLALGNISQTDANRTYEIGLGQNLKVIGGFGDIATFDGTGEIVNFEKLPTIGDVANPPTPTQDNELITLKHFNDNNGAGGAGTDNQTASEVSFTATGNTTSTDVQGAIEELQTEVDSNSLKTGISVAQTAAIAANSLGIFGKENDLGNPTTDGDVLSSLIDGTRSWITPNNSTGGDLWSDPVDSNILPDGLNRDLGSLTSFFRNIFVDNIIQETQNPRIEMRGTDNANDEGFRFGPTANGQDILIEFLDDVNGVTASNTINASGSPVNPTDLVTKAYGDANYLGAGNFSLQSFQDVVYENQLPNQTYVKFVRNVTQSEYDNLSNEEIYGVNGVEYYIIESAPTGYSISNIDLADTSNVTFDFVGGEIGSALDWSITDGTNTLNGFFRPIESATETISIGDISGFADGTVTLTVSSINGGGTGVDVVTTATKTSGGGGGTPSSSVTVGNPNFQDSDADLTLDLPSSLVVGNLLVAYVGQANNFVDYNEITGWTKIDEVDGSFGALVITSAAYYKVIDQALIDGVQNVVISNTGTTGSGIQGGLIEQYSGNATTGTIVENISSSSNNARTTGHTINEITTTSDGSLSVSYFFFENFVTYDVPPTIYNSRPLLTTILGSDVSIGIMFKDTPTAATLAAESFSTDITALTNQIQFEIKSN